MKKLIVKQFAFRFLVLALVVVFAMVVFRDFDIGLYSIITIWLSAKVIDIVLAEKQIADIRDESGNSRKEVAGAAVVPGYVCFNLTYEEINKVELAKRQGTLFIGSVENYYKEGSQAATFMTGATMPNF